MNRVLVETPEYRASILFMKNDMFPIRNFNRVSRLIMRNKFSEGCETGVLISGGDVEIDGLTVIGSQTAIEAEDGADVTGQRIIHRP